MPPVELQLGKRKLRLRYSLRYQYRLGTVKDLPDNNVGKLCVLAWALLDEPSYSPGGLHQPEDVAALIDPSDADTIKRLDEAVAQALPPAPPDVADEPPGGGEREQTGGSSLPSPA